MALAFGEHDAARRVKNVLKWKKETPRVAFLAAAAVLVVVSLCLTRLGTLWKLGAAGGGGRLRHPDLYLSDRERISVLFALRRGL